MNDYYVYEWIRLDTNEPFYVGKGHGDRWRITTRGNNYHFNNIVKKVDVVVNILHENLSENEAYELEVYYIWLYRDEIGYELCNITDGGDGCICRGEMNNKSIKVVCLNNGHVYDSICIARERHGGGYFDIKKCCDGTYNYAGFDEQLGYLSWCYYDDYAKLTEEEIQQRILLANNSKCGERNSFYGKHHSDETKQKLKEAATGRVYSEDTKKKLSELRKGEKNHMFGKKGKENPNFGKKCSEETKNKLKEANGTKIRCVELDISFLSLNDAEKYIRTIVNGSTFCRKSLSNYLNGKTKHDWYGEIEINGVLTKLHWELI